MFETKYIGPTDRKPARIRVKDHNTGRQRIASYPSGLEAWDAHRQAFVEYAALSGDHGAYVAGATRTGYMFVFAGNTRRHIAI
jgi:hypothetical protein